MEHRGERLAILFLDPLLRQVQTFGFTCTPSTFGSMPKSTRRLSRSCPEPPRFKNDPPVLPTAPSTDTLNLLDTMREIATLKQNFPPESIRTYIISGTTGLKDMLSVAWLAEANGIFVAARTGGDAPADSGLMPVPLFRIDRRSPPGRGDLPRALDESGVSVATRLVAARPRGDAWLLRQQQGWRDADQHLGVTSPCSVILISPIKALGACGRWRDGRPSSAPHSAAHAHERDAT